MSTTQTLREQKRLRLHSDAAQRYLTEADELEASLDPHVRWCLEQDARDILEGQPGNPPLTLREIVAICKEIRAERCVEEQEQKNAACR